MAKIRRLLEFPQINKFQAKTIPTKPRSTSTSSCNKRKASCQLLNKCPNNNRSFGLSLPSRIIKSMQIARATFRLCLMVLLNCKIRTRCNFFNSSSTHRCNISKCSINMCKTKNTSFNKSNTKLCSTKLFSINLYSISNNLCKSFSKHKEFLSLSRSIINRTLSDCPPR